jgi:DNA-binding protein H-NS
MSRLTATAQLEKIRAAKLKLEKEEQRLMSRNHDKTLAQIVQLAEKAGLSAAQISAAMGVKGKAKTSKAAGSKPAKAKRATAGKKVAPKYRNPADANQTWTGRGRTPLWVQALQTAGNLASAEIKAEATADVLRRTQDAIRAGDAVDVTPDGLLKSDGNKRD